MKRVFTWQQMDIVRHCYSTRQLKTWGTMDVCSVSDYAIAKQFYSKTGCINSKQTLQKYSIAFECSFVV